ncbi:FN3 associated domain-containing protein [uncultured Lacinutrix sp.]|uniref:FN3 associated domain-containing protein n=1 Tax=uncultured Lacinutrix sp. TaxID=574032 RepID=UPI002601B880|nr:FN3 associated domain-containing protein [uncultured Lacinutrix sp.]
MRCTILIVVLLFIGCAKNKKNVYLQEQQISLAQPRVNVTSTIIDSSVVATANLDMENVDIYYTNDGTKPNQKSLMYNTPLKIKEQGNYKFRAFHPDWKPSAVTKLKLYKKGYRPNKIDWETNITTTYPGIGEATVVNQKKGSLNFRDKQWFGSDSIVKATVNFKEKTYVESMIIGYLVDTKSWIFSPSQVILCFSKTDSITINLEKLKAKDLRELNDIEIRINKTIDSINITVVNTIELPEWHPGKGSKAWLFMDEWIFN